MQLLRQASALLCTACIAAELVAQLTGSGWPRRCIKAAAGLYILAVLTQILPGVRAEWEAVEVPAAAAASFGTVDEAILRQAEAQLESTLAAQCREQTGVPVQLEILLGQTAAGTMVLSVRCVMPAGCSAQQREQTAFFLRDALGMEAEMTEDGGAGP
ncbi:MAG: hypothetical protein ACI4JC_07480 [Faecalibacterium sp.]